VAGDFVEADDGENKKKGGEIRCRLEEVSVGVGLVVGAEALAEVGEEALAEVIPMPGAGVGMVCLMVILMGDTDLVTHTMVTVQCSPMATTHGKGA